MLSASVSMGVGAQDLGDACSRPALEWRLGWSGRADAGEEQEPRLARWSSIKPCSRSAPKAWLAAGSYGVLQREAAAKS